MYIIVHCQIALTLSTQLFPVASEWMLPVFAIVVILVVIVATALILGLVAYRVLSKQ